MPKVTGPLFSLAASGTFRKSLTFMTRGGANIVRGHVVPRDPQTPAQVAHRDNIADAAATWRLQDAQTRAAWQAAAAMHSMNAFAYWLQQWVYQDSSGPYPPSIP